MPANQGQLGVQGPVSVQYVKVCGSVRYKISSFRWEIMLTCKANARILASHSNYLHARDSCVRRVQISWVTIEARVDEKELQCSSTLIAHTSEAIKSKVAALI